MIRRHWAYLIGLLFVIPLQLRAQSNTATAAGLAAGAALGASTSQSATSASSAGGANAPIEMNIMVYGGIKQIAADMAKSVRDSVSSMAAGAESPDLCRTTKQVLLEDTTSIPLLSLNATWDAMQQSLAKVLNDLSSQVTNEATQIIGAQAEVTSAIQAFEDRKREADEQAAAAARAKKKKPPASLLNNPVTQKDLLALQASIQALASVASTGTTAGSASGAPTSPAATSPIGLTYLGDISSAITAAKAAISYSSSSVSPATQSLTTALANDLCSYHIALFTSASTINLAAAASELTGRLVSLQSLNASIQAALNVSTTLPSLSDDQKKDKTLQALVDKDTAQIKALAALIAANASTASQLMTSFLSWQSGSDGNGGVIITDVIRAVMLKDALGNAIAALQVNIDAAGGNTRTNNLFFLNLFYTPKPSFNGGVVVTYELRNAANQYIAGDTLKVLYDYSKWKPSCYTMKHGTEVNGTVLNDGRDTSPRSGHWFLCETE